MYTTSLFINDCKHSFTEYELYLIFSLFAEVLMLGKGRGKRNLDEWEATGQFQIYLYIYMEIIVTTADDAWVRKIIEKVNR